RHADWSETTGSASTCAYHSAHTPIPAMPPMPDSTVAMQSRHLNLFSLNMSESVPRMPMGKYASPATSKNRLNGTTSVSSLATSITCKTRSLPPVRMRSRSCLACFAGGLEGEVPDGIPALGLLLHGQLFAES